MKLTHRIGRNLLIAISLILGLWAVLFYTAVVDEVNDETDDALANASETLMLRILADDTVKAQSNLDNSFYRIDTLTSSEAEQMPHVYYTDSMVYIPSKNETEPARIRTAIFRHRDCWLRLTVAIPNIEKSDLREAILFWVLFLYAGLLVVIMLINLWVYKRSFRPLFRLLKWLDGYKLGEPHTPLNNDTDIFEFRQLNEAIQRSTDRMEKAFEKQKLFTGNASHEMQTPLAVAMNRLEMLMEDETLSEQHLQELAKTYQTLEYMTRLNKTLLLLFKIENGQFMDKKELKINDIIRKTASDLSEMYAYKNIDVNISEKSILHLTMSETLGSVLIINILKNGFVHNCPNGKIVIEVNKSGFRVGNTSQAEALPQEAVFNRFYQGKKAKESTGLGLALAKAVCDAEMLQLQYHYAENMHWFVVSKRQ